MSRRRSYYLTAEVNRAFKSGVYAVSSALLFPVLAYAQAFDPRKLDHMPTPAQLPPVNFTSDQIHASCMRLFNGKQYVANSVTQPLGRTRDYGWPFPNPMIGEFKTGGAISTPASAKSPVCAVRYSWKFASAYVSAGAKNVAAWFNGSILYTVSPPPYEKSGYLMVADGDKLRLTRYFYWELENGLPKPGATIHISWGLYTPE